MYVVHTNFYSKIRSRNIFGPLFIKITNLIYFGFPNLLKLILPVKDQFIEIGHLFTTIYLTCLDLNLSGEVKRSSELSISSFAIISLLITFQVIQASLYSCQLENFIIVTIVIKNLMAGPQ